MQPHAPATTFSGWISRWFATCLPSQASTLPLHKKLAPRALFKVALSPEGKITCTHGRLWVTASSHPGDIILRAGDSISVPRISGVIIEALEPSAFEMKRGAHGKRPSKPFVMPV